MFAVLELVKSRAQQKRRTREEKMMQRLPQTVDALRHASGPGKDMSELEMSAREVALAHNHGVELSPEGHVWLKPIAPFQRLSGET